MGNKYLFFLMRIPGLYDYRYPNLSISNSTVDNLINPLTREWKREVIYNTFGADVASKIVQIPLARVTQEDVCVWRGEPSGEFTVRNAYRILQEKTLRDILNSTSINIKNFTINYGGHISLEKLRY